MAEAFPETRVLAAPQLMRTRTVRAIAIGPSAWFPPAIVRAPRAEHLTFTYFGWLRDRDPEPDLLVGSPSHVRSAISRPPARSASRVPLPAGTEAEAEAAEWIPRIEWNAVTRAAHRTAASGHGEPVRAQLFVLVSGDGVYLDVKDGAQAYIAELEHEINVRQVSVASLREGTFLILRTAGEGDYIRERGLAHGIPGGALAGASPGRLEGEARAQAGGVRRESCVRPTNSPGGSAGAGGQRQAVGVTRQHPPERCS